MRAHFHLALALADLWMNAMTYDSVMQSTHTQILNIHRVRLSTNILSGQATTVLSNVSHDLTRCDKKKKTKQIKTCLWYFEFCILEKETFIWN